MERAKLVCLRGGKPIDNPKKIRAKHSCKCGCQAFIRIRRCEGGRYIIVASDNVHNHDFVCQELMKYVYKEGFV